MCSENTAVKNYIAINTYQLYLDLDGVFRTILSWVFKKRKFQYFSCLLGPREGGFFKTSVGDVALRALPGSIDLVFTWPVAVHSTRTINSHSVVLTVVVVLQRCRL